MNQVGPKNVKNLGGKQPSKRRGKESGEHTFYEMGVARKSVSGLFRLADRGNQLIKGEPTEPIHAPGTQTVEESFSELRTSRLNQDYMGKGEELSGSERLLQSRKKKIDLHPEQHSENPN